MLQFLFNTFLTIFNPADPEREALRLLVSGGLGLTLIALIIRLISKIKSFAFFGG